MGVPGDTWPGCSRDSQTLSCEGTSLRTCLSKLPGHLRCETPQGQTTCAGRQSCKGCDAPWGDKLHGNPPPALPSPCLVGPQPWGHRQNPHKPNQPGELVCGIYSLGAFIGKKRHYGLQVSRRTAVGREKSLSPPKSGESWLEYNCNPASVLTIPALICHEAFPGSS